MSEIEQATPKPLVTNFRNVIVVQDTVIDKLAVMTCSVVDENNTPCCRVAIKDGTAVYFSFSDKAAGTNAEWAKREVYALYAADLQDAIVKAVWGVDLSAPPPELAEPWQVQQRILAAWRHCVAAGKFPRAFPKTIGKPWSFCDREGYSPLDAVEWVMAHPETSK